MERMTVKTGEVTVCPSLLAADFSDLAGSLARLGDSAPILHLDIMDGHYVPNISFGPPVVAALRPHVRQLFDVHLMVTRPQDWIEPFAEAGADFLVIHAEAAVHADRLIQSIRDLGIKAGLALNPATPLDVTDWLLDKLDLILLMTVNPGFGGQRFLPHMLDKIRAMRERIDASGYSVLLQVDGGIDRHNAAQVVEAGADLLVAGSAVFASEDPARAVAEILQAAGRRG